MRRSILDAFDDHPADDDERPPASWAVAVIDDCDGCGMGELRVVLTLEEVGRAGTGVVAHLAVGLDASSQVPGRTSTLKYVHSEQNPPLQSLLLSVIESHVSGEDTSVQLSVNSS